MDLSSVAFLFDVYGQRGTDEASSRPPPEHVGACYLLPTHFKSTQGHVQVPILTTGRFQPVGQLEAFHLIVTPLDVPSDLSVGFARHWKGRWSGLEVGHRGMGDSYSATRHCANVMENTMASLKSAISHGADMVEFDVHLSKDLIPVIYHNFDLTTAVARKGEDEKSVLVRMPMRNLTLEQLHNLKIHHVEELQHGLKSFAFVDADHEPFPTLERALKELPAEAGFNVEMKWDMEYADGSRDCGEVGSFEMNLFVDTILRVVLAHAGNRKIVFSSFNPDLCTALRMKQNRFPVLFLTQGVTAKYGKYRDPRCWNVKNGAHFAKAAELLGLNIMAENLLREPALVQNVRESGLVLFCWTDDKNDKATIEELRRMRLDGIVYDRVDMNCSKDRKESVFLLEKDDDDDDDDEGVNFSSNGSTSASCRSEDEERISKEEDVAIAGDGGCDDAGRHLRVPLLNMA